MSRSNPHPKSSGLPASDVPSKWSRWRINWAALPGVILVGSGQCIGILEKYHSVTTNLNEPGVVPKLKIAAAAINTSVEVALILICFAIVLQPIAMWILTLSDRCWAFGLRLHKAVNRLFGIE